MTKLAQWACFACLRRRLCSLSALSLSLVAQVWPQASSWDSNGIIWGRLGSVSH